MTRDLTPEERALYANGSWLRDPEQPRCIVCGCLRENHVGVGPEIVGRCLVCSCPMYEERVE